MLNVFLSSNLRFLRESKTKFNQKELAKEVGLGGTTYANYETGHSEPSFLVLARLVEYYRINAHDLLYKDLSKAKTSPQELPREDVKSKQGDDSSSFAASLRDLRGEMLIGIGRLENMMIQLLQKEDHTSDIAQVGEDDDDKDNTSGEDEDQLHPGPRKVGRSKKGI